MGLETIYPLALFSIILYIIVTQKLRRNLKKNDSIQNIPPGPWKLPIVGNIPHLVGSAPHRKLRELAEKFGPLMHLQLGEVFFIVVSSPEYAREVMKTHDVIFASRPPSLTSQIVFYNSTDIAFSPYGDYWRQLRKICTMELLSIKRVQSHWPIREEEITNLIKRIGSEEGSVINLTQAVISLLYTITSRAAFGKKYMEQEEFISVVREVLKLAGGFYIGDLFPSAKWLQNLSGMRPLLEKLHQKVDRILENIINDHREAKSRTKEGLVEAEEEDLIDVLLKFEDRSSDRDFLLTNENIKAIIFDIFTGGSDTAATTINWAMAEMIKDQRVLKKAQSEVREIFERRGRVDESCIEELKYLKAVIKEVLRLHPPGPLLIPRECGQACEIKGYHIPVKSRVIVNAWAIGRDPNYWTEPENFYPERFSDNPIDYKGTSFEYIPFGAGRRICPGMNFAVANVELVLAMLLYNFDWRLPNGMKSEDLDMAEVFGASVIRKEDLYLLPIASPTTLRSQRENTAFLASSCTNNTNHGARGSNCPHVATTLEAVQRELTISRQANETLLKTNEDAQNAMTAMMNELRTLRSARHDNRPPTPPPHTATPTPHTLHVDGGAGNNEEGASHHDNGSSHHIMVHQPHVQHVGGPDADERRLTAFRKHKLPSFTGGYDLVMRCPDALKLVYSVYMLEGEVEDWWTNTVQPLEAEGQEITSQLFETLFLNNYYPREARERKQNEYNDLKQGSMTIDQYFAKFNELVKYAHYGRALPTSAEMTSKFQLGLNEKMSRKMSNCDIREFSKFVNQCRKVEEVYSVTKTKKPSKAQASSASRATGSNSWKNKKMKSKKLSKPKAKVMVLTTKAWNRDNGALGAHHSAPMFRLQRST
ncbi:cytochrome P450 71D11-like [Gastrolobium bilobum]|uniref:cytochrome P450 71D11-like n=1 Tax=Gastrolobium bilobum TaxID=150636 RepID=UPI002AAFFF9C|nr:cytochrome P450 71D11-like [Gastrolobium bilobum]